MPDEPGLDRGVRPDPTLPTEKIKDDMREVPTSPPEVVPAISSEQMVIAAGVGVAAFAKQNPEQGFTGDEDKAWHVQPAGSTADNDEESHVRPTDNDGETVPRDEVVDEVGG